MDRERLLEAAREAALSAYAPYSHFRVGAALVLDTPEGPFLVTGANVENASFGLSFCAERSALAAACTAWGKFDKEHQSSPKISHMAIACIDAPADAPASYRSPCGACRQWFAELAPEAVFYIDGVQEEFHLDDLLPDAFRL